MTDKMEYLILKPKDYHLIEKHTDPDLYEKLTRQVDYLCQVVTIDGKLFGYCIFEMSDDICDIKELNTIGIDKNMTIRIFMLESLIAMMKTTTCKVIVYQLFEEDESFKAQQEAIKILGFELSESRYFERFSLQAAAKGLVRVKNIITDKIFSMNEVSKENLNSFDEFLKSNNLFYYLKRSNVIPELSFFYCPDGILHEIKGCFIVGHMEEKQDKELSIEYIYMDEAYSSGTAIYGMITKAFVEANKNNSGKLMINAYSANEKIESLIEKLTGGAVEKKAVEEYYYICNG